MIAQHLRRSPDDSSHKGGDDWGEFRKLLRYPGSHGKEQVVAAGGGENTNGSRRSHLLRQVVIRPPLALHLFTFDVLSVKFDERGGVNL